MMNADIADESKRGDGTASSESEAACEAIMEATYRALCAQGAADLTVQAIADEFEKSKSLIFYHYDSKEQLLSSFLAYLFGKFEQQVAATDTKEPDEQLDSLINAVLFGPPDNKDFQTAMFELRSQAPFNEAYRKQFQANRTYTHDLFEAVIERGIEEGVFTATDASQAATMILTTIDGARTQLVVFGDDASLDTTREIIDTYLDTMLFADAGGPV